MSTLVDKVEKVSGKVAGHMSAYAQYGWGALEPDGSISFFNPLFVRYTNEMACYHTDPNGRRVKLRATFLPKEILFDSVDEFGRVFDMWARDYPVGAV